MITERWRYGQKNDWAKRWPVFFAQSFFCLKTADFWNAARTVRSPGFLGLALQRAIEFFRRLTVMHTKRWHAHYKTGGTGHLYQGRFKSFPIQTDGHLLTVMRYVERNPVRANLIELAENWEWSSAYARLRRADERRWLAIPEDPPLPRNWRSWVNKVET